MFQSPLYRVSESFSRLGTRDSSLSFNPLFIGSPSHLRRSGDRHSHRGFQSPLYRVSESLYDNRTRNPRNQLQSPLYRVSESLIFPEVEDAKSFNPLFIGSPSHSTRNGNGHVPSFNPLFIGSPSHLNLRISRGLDSCFNPLFIGSPSHWTIWTIRTTSSFNPLFIGSPSHCRNRGMC